MHNYLARQPVFDRRKRLFAYEILYRGNLDNVFPENFDGEVATSTVLAHALINIGLETITAGKKALINFTEKHLLDGTPTQLPQQYCIVEILEDVPASEPVLAACRELKRHGYTLALDDFNFDQRLDPLVDCVDIIKVDFQAASLEEIQGAMDRYRGHGKLKFLAEKIETYEEFERSLGMGFHFFQGFFFSKPELIRRRKLDIAAVSLLTLMAEVNRPDFSFKRVEKMISADVALSYKLLLYINSAFYSLVSKVKSIRHALSYLGESGTRQFVCLAVTSQLAVTKTSELIRAAMVRAQLSKLLAKKSHLDYDESELFLLGLFSLLEAMLDTPIKDLLAKLSLAPDLNAALSDRSGPLAPFLCTILAYETGNLDECLQHLEEIGVSSEDMVTLYFEALKWADLFSEEMPDT